MGVKGKNKLLESIISYLIDLKFLLLKWPCVGQKGNINIDIGKDIVGWVGPGL